MQDKRNLIVTTSWDDGTTDDIRLAELLDKYRLSGSFYICRADSVLDLLSDANIVALDKRFEVGAHTINHPDLTQIPLSDVSKEIHESKALLEEILGHDITMFCYPYGKYNSDVEKEVVSSGLSGGRTCDPRGLKTPLQPYRLDITLLASDKSPLMALKICLQTHLVNVSSLYNWESRAKAVFDLALKKGGLYHIYGHSSEFEADNEWDKIERVFSYISNHKDIRYLSNGESLAYFRQARSE